MKQYYFCLILCIITACNNNTEKLSPAVTPTVSQELTELVNQEGSLTTCTHESTYSIYNPLPDLKGKKLIIAVKNTKIPFYYTLRETSKVSGFDYKVWCEICNRLNCTPTFKELESSVEDIIAMTAEGEVHAMAAGIEKIEEYTQKVDFSDAYLIVQERLLVHKVGVKFKDRNSFRDQATLQIGQLVGSEHYASAVAFVGEDRVVPFTDSQELIDALSNRNIDAVLVDEFVEAGYNGYQNDRLKLTGSPINTNHFGFAYPPCSQEEAFNAIHCPSSDLLTTQENLLLEPVNLALDSMRIDGTLDDLTNFFFSSSFTVTISDVEN